MNDSSKKGTGDDDKPGLKAPRRIVLKKTVEEGSIKQSFAHGRSKSVVVEVRRKRTFVKTGSDPEEGGAERSVAAREADRLLSGGVRVGGDGKPDARAKPHILTPMTPEEKQAYQEELERRKQLQQEQEEREREERERREREQQEIARVREERERLEREATLLREAEERRVAEELRERMAQTVVEIGTLPSAEEAAGVDRVVISEVVAEVVMPVPVEMVASAVVSGGAVAGVEAEAAVEEAYVEVLGAGKKKLSRAQREEMARQKSEDLVTRRLAEVDDLRESKLRSEQLRAPVVPVDAVAATESTERRPAKAKATKPKVVEKLPTREKEEFQDGTPVSVRRSRFKASKPMKRPDPRMATGPVVREVIVPDMIAVGELANRMAVKTSDVIKFLITQGMMVTINQVIDQETAILVVEEMGHKARAVSESAAIDAELAESVDTEEERIFRPPVVTVMGHVDHGKTSLLDAIRKTDVTSREFGGITQHIGAYQVTMSTGGRITFLDTPGHAAFTAMRARGAQVTDIVVLVVAADDGVMPQTVEAVNHAKAAKVPILVAVNKIDKPGADPERVMQQLTEYELVPESWGGETIFVKVSAKTGEGVSTLQEMILLQSEVLDLRANPAKRGRGAIVEAKLDKGRGAVATCLVQNGTLRAGDIFVVGSEWGKIRGLVNDKGEAVDEALPSMPVEIIGLSGVPNAGDELITVPDERRAREIASFRMRKQKELSQADQAHANLGDIFTQIREGAVEELKTVLKADVQGSVEAVRDALTKISHPSVRVSVIHTGVGGITESDIMLAVASNAIVVGFNVRADAKARALAKQEGIDLRFYNVIYHLVDEVTMALEGMLRPTIHETVLGHALIREVFRVSKVGQVAGCVITDGVVQRQATVRLLRDQVVIYEGPMQALKHFKEDVKEVKEGMDCGISLERYNDYRVGDVLEAYVQEEVRQAIGG